MQERNKAFPIRSIGCGHIGTSKFNPCRKQIYAHYTLSYIHCTLNTRSSHEKGDSDVCVIRLSLASGKAEVTKMLPIVTHIEDIRVVSYAFRF